MLNVMGNPEKAYPTVHIAGTKGKGSISVFTSSILVESGYKVGLFTSPHLMTIRERIVVNNKMITEEDLAFAVGELSSFLGNKPGSREFSFFEIYTMLAMLYFRMQHVDIAVFECGLGGRLDSTNVINPIVCGFAPISYDHFQVLGTTLEEIAGEKAAIIKTGTRCVSSHQTPQVMKIIEDMCTRHSVPLSVAGRDINYDVERLDEKGGCFNIYGRDRSYEKCSTLMLGRFQAENCAVAVGICEELELAGTIKMYKSAVRTAISKAYLPGRMEILSRDPLLVIDGAQNAASAAELKYSVEEIFKYDRLILLLGLSSDKDIEGVCREFSQLADEFIVTRASVKRAADPYVIKGYLRGARSVVAEDAKEALGRAFSSARKNDMILVAGSFFLIGEVKQLLESQGQVLNLP